MTPEKPKIEWEAGYIANELEHGRISIDKSFLDSEEVKRIFDEYNINLHHPILYELLGISPSEGKE